MTVAEFIKALDRLRPNPNAQILIWQEDCNDGWYTPGTVRIEGGEIVIWTTVKDAA